jgi:hypothetical protein
MGQREPGGVYSRVTTRRLCCDGSILGTVLVRRARSRRRPDVLLSYPLSRPRESAGRV